MTYSKRIIKRKAMKPLYCRGCTKVVNVGEDVVEIPPQMREVILLCLDCCKQLGDMALNSLQPTNKPQ